MLRSGFQLIQSLPASAPGAMRVVMFGVALRFVLLCSGLLVGSVVAQEVPSVDVPPAQLMQQDDGWKHLFDDSVKSEGVDVVEAPPPDEPPPAFPEHAPELAAELSGWITWLVRTNTPPTYEDLRKWGKTRRMYDGVKFRREGWKVETQRRWKEANHGTWSRYLIELHDLQAVRIELNKLQMLPNGKVSVEITIDAPLHVLGRTSVWQYDLQLISLHADADATVRLWLATEIEIALVPLTVPPDILLRPVVTQARLELLSFRFQGISKLRGPVARALGDGMEGFVRERVEKYGDKLVEKANKAIQKKQDRLRISSQQWINSQLKHWTTQPSP